MTTVEANVRRRRGDGFVPQDAEHGYHDAWYPIATSPDLVQGQLLGVPTLNGRAVAFRDDAGKPAVLSAYCRHLGADLSTGELRDGCVRCPFHHWTYDASGMCVEIPQAPGHIPA